MSEKDPPSGPFGRSDRTVIRPNPGARRPVAPAAPPPAPPAAGTPQVSYPGATPTGSTEEWISTPAAPKPAEEKQLMDCVLVNADNAAKLETFALSE